MKHYKRGDVFYNRQFNRNDENNSTYPNNMYARAYRIRSSMDVNYVFRVFWIAKYDLLKKGSQTPRV